MLLKVAILLAILANLALVVYSDDEQTTIDNTEEDESYQEYDESEYISGSEDCSTNDNDQCPPNEEVNSCANGGCDRRNCSQYGRPALCIDPITCISGCVCVKGYLRAQNGTCVQEQQCDICNGDSNAHPGCSNNCGRLCSNYKDNLICTLQCRSNVCDCNSGYVYDENIGACVKPEKCSPICKANEYFSTCVQSHCSHQNCTQISKSISCPRIDPKFCRAGCLCKENFYRAKNGTCVPKEECDVCGGDENSHPGCSNNCGRLCSNYNKNVICTRECKQNVCDCNTGLVYDENTKKCVKPEKCSPTCKANEYFSTCVQSDCSYQNCSQISQSLSCPRIDPKYCKSGCLCKNNFYRAKNGTCVPKDQCDVCGGDENAHPGCSNNCGRLCTNYNDSVICTRECKPNVCDCNIGLVYDENIKKCVDPKECTTCPDGEIYSTCPPTKCDGEYCPKSRYDLQFCPSPRRCLKPRCICGFNRHRDRNTGRCIATTSCPPFPCDGPNEMYESYPPTCPGQNCSDFINNSTCPKFHIGIVIPARPTCRCKKNYYRNSNGTCVFKTECKQCPGQNEHWDPCAKTCSPQTCDSIGKRYHCPVQFANVTCNGACRCDTNYTRDAHNNCIPISQCPKQTSNDDVEGKLASGINACALRFLQVLWNDNPNNNLITSASSLLNVLAQVAAFASGDTQLQLLELLNLDSRSEIEQAFKPLLNSLRDQENVTLNIADRVYSNKQYTLNRDFKQFTRNYFAAESKTLDFSKNVEAANTINNWVKNATNNEIPTLISADALSQDTILILIDAIYCKCPWKKEFDTKNTIDRPFYKTNGETIDIPTMYAKGEYYEYYDSDVIRAQALEIKTVSDQISVLIILPHDHDGLNFTLKTLSEQPDLLKSTIQNMTSTKLDLYLPKFEIESSISLVKPLTKLGVTDVFDPSKAELSGMTEKPQNLYVSDGIQKARFRLDEKGSIAAAATAISVAYAASVSISPLPVFRTDHAFLFCFMYQTNAKYPLFCGVYVKPNNGD